MPLLMLVDYSNTESVLTLSTQTTTQPRAFDPQELKTFLQSTTNIQTDIHTNSSPVPDNLTP